MKIIFLLAVLGDYTTTRSWFDSFDDKMKIKNTNLKGPETTGAILIRNSWGKEWGEKGYGWLPYEYLLQGLADEWWSLLKTEWIESGEFML